MAQHLKASARIAMGENSQHPFENSESESWTETFSLRKRTEGSKYDFRTELARAMYDAYLELARSNNCRRREQLRLMRL